MSDSNRKVDSNSATKSRPEIQRYSVAKGKYSSKLNKNDRLTSNSAQNFNSRPSTDNQQRQQNRNQHNRHENFSYSTNDEDERYYGHQGTFQQRRTPQKTVNTREIPKSEPFVEIKKESSQSETEPDFETKIGSMTFENRTLTETKSSNNRAGLIYLNKKEEQEQEPKNLVKQLNNRPRKKSAPNHEPQPITQSSRGLNNVTRTLYDPNAPTSKTSTTNFLVQTLSNVKISNPPVSTSVSAPSTPNIIETSASTQEIQQKSFFHQELGQTNIETSANNDENSQNLQAHKVRRKEFHHWVSQIQNLEKQLMIYLNNSPHMDANFSRMMESKITLQKAYVHAMMTDIEAALSKNLDSQLWKSCFHTVIECFRQYDKQSADHVQVKKCIDVVIEDAEKFFLDFIRQLESNFNIDTKLYFDPNSYPPVLTEISSKYALLCTQHCFLNLGDLARYKETNRNGSDYSAARRHYQSARLLYPKNGKSCKQLAILAVMTHRRLDAIYYYVRALATSNLNDSVKQNLNSLFEEARRRLESFEKEIKDREKKNERKIHAGNQKLEIWKRNDGTIVGKTMDENFERDGSVSQQELIHWFILNYITLHGKLYTRTGMETYAEVCSKMLRQFESLLRNDPCVFGRQQLVQMMAINMYQIEVSRQIKSSVDLVVRSQYEESSLQLALDMFGLLTEQTSKNLERHIKSRSASIHRGEPSAIFNSWLKNVFPSLKIFTDWMTCNVGTFIPLPDQLPAELGPHPNVLQSLVNVINRMRTIDRTHIPLSSHLSNFDSVPVILEEDIEMSGFYPLLTLPANSVQTSSVVSLDEAKDCKRIARLCFFADYLCGLDQPIFIYDVQQKVYRPALICSNEVENESSLSNENQNIQTDSDQNSNELSSTLTTLNNADSSPSKSSQNEIAMEELRKKKQILENQLAERQKQEQAVKEILNKSRSIEIEVTPRFIVLDTNCFVNYLPTIEKLIKLNRFTIIVPLIVICELDKLSASSFVDDDSYEHAEMVRRQSIQAVKMIEQCFANKERRVQAMTSEGNVLDSIQFRHEAKRNESNDDTILGCCLKYCHDNPRDFFPPTKDGSIRLQRSVVLITDDRNLRLKAQARNVPVKDLNKFLELAQVNLDK